MNFLIFSYLILALFSCSNIKQINSEEGKSVQFTAPPLLPEITPTELKIRAGEVSYLFFELPEDRNGKLLCRDSEIKTFFKGGHHAFISETYFSKELPFKCFWKSGEQSILVANVEVLKKKFPSERLRVNKRRVTPPPADLKRIKKEREFLAVAYSKSPKYPLFKTPFAYPIHSKVTSKYGSRRVFNNKKQTQHLGTDYRAGVGTPIKASNSGKVIVSRNLFYSGNSVSIDHGLEIFTLYGHLSKLNVVEGEYVPKGTVIGLAGATGRVTGPHLHWGVKVNELAVEGDSLIDSSKNFYQKAYYE